MTGHWIKLRTDIHTVPEILQIADLTGLEVDFVVGKIIRLWAWADQYCLPDPDDPDGEGDAVSVTQASLDRHVFAHEGFADAVTRVGWLLQTEAGIAIPKFGRHNGSGAKTRSQASRRNSAYKKRRRKGDAPTVTPPSPSASPREEKSREDNTQTPPNPPAGGAKSKKTWRDVIREDRFSELAASKDFMATWEDWETYRRERKVKALGPTGLARAFNKVLKHGIEASIWALGESMASGWAGFFPENHTATGGKNGHPTQATGPRRGPRGTYAERDSCPTNDWNPKPKDRPPDVDSALPGLGS